MQKAIRCLLLRIAFFLAWTSAQTASPDPNPRVQIDRETVLTG
jgi:hypothetical protein